MLWNILILLMGKSRYLNIVAIIPARGGSKGIPKKNIQILNNKPLIAHTIESAFESGVAKEVYVTTDSEEIIEIAVKSNARVIRRPAEISSDTSSTESALIHAVEIIKRDCKWTPEYVLTLPPTSPLRSAETIKRFVSHYLSVSDEFDAMTTLTESRGDYWVKNKYGKFERVFPGEPRRRQDRKPVYLENSAIYITKTDLLIATNSILGNSCAGYVIDKVEAIDINDSLDLLWAEFALTHIYG